MLPHAKCGIQCGEECRVAEGLEQALYGALRQKTRSDVFVSDGSDEDGRNLLLSISQFTIELGARHTRHGDVDNQTAGSVYELGCQERFCRRESLRGKAELLQQIGKRFSNRLVVIDNRNE